jgi:hypothetical protein
MADETVALWRGSVAPGRKETKGFKGAYRFGDHSTGKGITITLWETEPGAAAMDTSGQYRQAVALFGAKFAAAPTREQFEVLFQM